MPSECSGESVGSILKLKRKMIYLIVIKMQYHYTIKCKIDYL